MRWHTQKHWRMKFRKDPDAGRVLFLGPLVLSLDVIARPRSCNAGAASGSGFQSTTGTGSTSAKKRTDHE
jgi:hypothetical protein